MNYKDKFNKERLSFAVILRDKKRFDECKARLVSELICVINVLEDLSFTRTEILNFVQEKITSSARSFYDYLMLFNYIEALDYVFENYKKITLDASFLQKIHKMVFEKVDDAAGTFRKGKVFDKSFKLKFIEAKEILNKLNEFDQLLLKKEGEGLYWIFECYYQFLIISPFKKGNILVGLLLLTAALLKSGYTPLVLRSIDKKRFFEVLENYQLKNKKEQYYAFMRSALGRSFQLVLGDVLDETKKENLLTIAKFAKLCDVPVSTIRYWMKEGHIKPVVFTPTGYALFDENQRIDIQEAKLTKMISKCMSSLKKGIEKATSQS